MGECSVQRRPSNGGRPGDLQSAWVGCRSRGRGLGSEHADQVLGKAYWTVSGGQVGLGGPSYVPVEVGAGVWRQQRWGPPPAGESTVRLAASSMIPTGRQEVERGRGSEAGQASTGQGWRGKAGALV